MTHMIHDIPSPASASLEPADARPPLVSPGSDRAIPRDAIAPPDGEHDRVSEASIESFPASDPPGWGSLRIGPPATP
jgi:hypothetical protein